MKTQADKEEVVRKLRPIDDALFEVLAEDIEVIQEMLRVILSDKGLIVDRVTPQRSVPNLLGRAVRLDAWCHLGDGRECNVEVQRADNDDHLRRVRYNSSGITWTETEKGTDFKNIPDLCVIYISEFDFLGGGHTIYHIDKVVRETGLCISDGLEEIFVNTNIDDGSAIADLMRCFLQSDVSNPQFPALSRKMNGIKNTREGVLGMCAVLDKYYKEEVQEVREEALAEGHAEGKERTENVFAQLAEAMHKHNCPSEDFSRVMSDAAFREKMKQKYGIE